MRLTYTDSDKDGKVDVLNGNIDVDGDGDLVNDIVKTRAYYAFGLSHNYGANSSLSAVSGREHPYGYNGKEENDELGLEWMDYGARNYDAALGRWMNIDALSDDYYQWSPYNYAMNNPVFLIDPDGNSVDTVYVNEQGEEIVNTNDGSDDVIVIKDEDLEEFEELVENTQEWRLNSEEWNKNIKADILGFKSIEEMEGILGAFANQWSRQGAIDFLQDPSATNALKMSFKETIAQNLNPLNHLPNPKIKTRVKVDVPQVRPKSNVPQVRPKSNVPQVKTTLDANVKPETATPVKHKNSWIEFNRQTGKGKFTKDKFGGSSKKAASARRAAYDKWKKENGYN